MVHVFVAPDDVAADHAVVRGDDARHLSTVLRAAPGMPLTVADGSGTVYRARVASIGEAVTVALTSAHNPAPPRPEIHVAHALPKGRKLDEVIQRLTELGVERIIPLHSARSQVRLTDVKAAKAHRRWSAVARAAAKQSRRTRLPIIDAVGDWRAWRPRGSGVVLWEEARTSLRVGLSRVTGARQGGSSPAAPAGPLVVAVGPEGGLTPAEVEATGLPAVTLGPTILRTEFASVAGVVAAMTLVGRFGS